MTPNGPSVDDFAMGQRYATFIEAIDNKLTYECGLWFYNEIHDDFNEIHCNT